MRGSMCDAPVFYASTEGQAQRIAQRIADVLRSAGLTSEAIDVTSDDAAAVDWTSVRGVIVGASLHAGAHQKEAARFIRTHRDRLNARPSWFFSVSLGIASQRPADKAAVQRLARLFPYQAQWCPRQVVCFAGRLAYTQYTWLTRLIMRHIARKEGGSTDTSRDHEYTNWAAVDSFAWQAAVDISTLAIPRATVPQERTRETTRVA